MTHFARLVELLLTFALTSAAFGQALFNGKKEQAIELAEQASIRGDYDSAIRILSTALTRNPQNPQALVDRANLLKVTGKYEAAVADYEALIKLNPTIAWHGYAELLATCPDKKFRDGVRAVKFAQQALNIAQTKYPRSQVVPNLMDTLAAAYAEQGKYQEAIKWQKTAIQQSGESQRDEMRARLSLYEAGKPYFQNPFPSAEKDTESK